MKFFALPCHFISALLLRLTLVLPLLIATAPAIGCAFHGVIEGNWMPLYPRSIEVAVAVREAADSKFVDPALLRPHVAGPLGYLRASKRLRDLGLLLAESAGASAMVPSVALLFVESGLWSRYVARGRTVETIVHADGPHPGDAVLITSEAVVAAILDGRLSSVESIRRGLLVFGGHPDAVGQLQTLFQHIGQVQTRTAKTQAVR